MSHRHRCLRDGTAVIVQTPIESRLHIEMDMVHGIGLTIPSNRHDGFRCTHINKSTIVSCFGNRKSSELIQRSTDACDSPFESANLTSARLKSLPAQWHLKKFRMDLQNACTCPPDRRCGQFAAINNGRLWHSKNSHKPRRLI